MKKWCRQHEEHVMTAEPSPELLAEHAEKIQILQHERLVHLIVTAMTAMVELFILDLVLLHPEFGALPAVIMLSLAVLLGFYFYHYFFLENTVQRWYRIEDEIREKISRV